MHLVVTGGTGFLGSWIVAVLLWADQALALDLDLTLVSRDPARVPFETGPRRKLLQLDLADGGGASSTIPGDLVIHGAVSSYVGLAAGSVDSETMISTSVAGTRWAICAAEAGQGMLLLLSSGAVYGPQQGPVDEGTSGVRDHLRLSSAYGEAKRAAEALCAEASAMGRCESVIARLFSFVGPRMPLDAHHAAGSFISDVLADRPVVVAGDGTPLRSYLYAGDLPEWCMALAARGVSGNAYNVGSPEAVSIRGLAEKLAAFGWPAPLPVSVREPRGGGPIDTYVPIVERAASLGLAPRRSLDEALTQTMDWHRR